MTTCLDPRTSPRESRSHIMSKRKKFKDRSAQRHAPGQSGSKESGLRTLYQRACELAERGDYAEARRLFEMVSQTAQESAQQALVHNDLAVLAVVNGDVATARQGFEKALACDSNCESARSNAALLQADVTCLQPLPVPSLNGKTAPAPVSAPQSVKVAILSFLFNWPSTGGGNVHTAELALFLGRAGYEVRHFFVRYARWQIGNVTGTPFPSQALEFDDTNWNVPAIQARIRQAIEAFKPDHVIITDSWNIKPILAEAVSGYPYILRFQAMECLCPLNNVRLLPETGRKGTAMRAPPTGHTRGMRTLFIPEQPLFWRITPSRA